MKMKINILIIAIILAIVLFGISTYMQKKMINYEATVSCLILAKDIAENEMVNREDFKKANVPISIVATQKIVKSFEEIEGLYAKDNIKSSQIAIKDQFDTRENLSIYEAEAGKEKLSIKIKNAENGMSFQIKTKSHVNIYATLRNEYANGFLMNHERMNIGDELEGYTIIKILENVEVLGVFTIDGVELEKSNSENLDSILISVTPEEAKQINLIRDIATFNITGINSGKITNSKASGEGYDLKSKEIESHLFGDEI
ncbi:MAG: hypothetical protein IJ220_06985 [Clostridia bacterium]|nr:hypothetical protein [Clostridia bacterium]